MTTINNTNNCQGNNNNEIRLAMRRIRSMFRREARAQAIGEGLRGCALTSRARRLYQNMLESSLAIRQSACQTYCS